MKTWETIKAFESFAGIGTQRMALKKQGIEHEVTAISEVDEYALLSYHAIHAADIEVKEASEEEMQRYMEEKNIPLDPKGKRKILKNKRLKDLYIASVASNNLGDISKIKGDEIPKVDLFTYSFPCFTKDNLVLTGEGYKPINEVAVGDKVLTHNNTYERVVRTFDNGIQPTVKVKAMGIDEIVTTPNHKFYVREKYREWDSDRRSYNRLFKEPQWKEIKDVTKDYYLGMAINQKSEIPKWNGITFYWDDGRSPRHKNELQELMDNQDFWWIIGRYLADGWTRTQGGIVFGIGKYKTSEFEDRLGKVFNYSSVEERSVVKYHVPLKELSNFVEQFGKGAFNKKLSKSVLNLPVDLLENFLEGYFSGDGSFINGYWKASSVSRELMLGIGQAVMKVYKRPYSLYKNIRPKTAIIEGRTVNQKDTYNLSFKKEVTKQDNAFHENGYVWIPFNAIEDAGNENVYDIEVNNAHSFTVQNVIVHNCQDISTAGQGKGLKKGSGTRSSLLWECERVIETVKPKYLLMENVKALVNKNNKPQFDIWLEYLEELGYKNFYEILNAKDYGIPQNRERVFCISILGEHEPYEFPKSIPLELRLKDILENEVDEKFYLDDDRVSQLTINWERVNKNDDLQVVANTSATGYDKSNVHHENGISPTIAARDYKGPNQVLQVGQYDTDARANSNRFRTYSPSGIGASLTTMGGGGLEPCVIVDDIELPAIGASRGRNPENPSDRTVGSPTEQRLEINKQGTSNTITTVQKDNYVVEPLGTLTAHNSDKFGAGYMDGLSKTLKANKHDISVVERVRRLAETARPDAENISPSLTTVQKDNYLLEPKVIQAVGDRGNHSYSIKDKAFTIPANPMSDRGQMIIESQYRIRKLTPLECWRLMGIADEDFKKASKVVSNSQLYKQAGNAIVVNVLEEIFKQMF